MKTMLTFLALLGLLMFPSAFVRAEVYTSGNQLSNLSEPPASITAIAGTPQSAQASTAFATRFKVMVRDSLGNPVPGVTVTWTPPLSGPSGTFAGGLNTAVTDSSGIATSATFTANLIAGSYVVPATAPGIPEPARFYLTNLSAPPVSITITAGAVQSTTVNTLFPVRFKILVRDGVANPVPSVRVFWLVPASGPSGTFDSAFISVTDTNGILETSSFRANTFAGSYIVRAEVQGIGAAAPFSLTNLPGPVAVEDQSDDITPSHFELLQNYPNPFNPTTTIKFFIPNVGTRHVVSLRVFDVLGREVATLVNEMKEPGRYEVQWDAGNFPSGVYFYKLSAGRFSNTKKLIVAK